MIIRCATTIQFLSNGIFATRYFDRRNIRIPIFSLHNFHFQNRSNHFE